MKRNWKVILMCAVAALIGGASSDVIASLSCVALNVSSAILVGAGEERSIMVTPKMLVFTYKGESRFILRIDDSGNLELQAGGKLMQRWTHP